MGIVWRPNTYDESIWRSVFNHNEYALPDHFQPEDVIVDIGAHIGSFTYSCLHRGAGLVIAVEPDIHNANLFRHNIHDVCRATDRVILMSGAAWRSDVSQRIVHYVPAGENTGGGGVLNSDGQHTRAIPFDEILKFAASFHPKGRIRMVKLDCEGSEWPALLTSERLLSVDHYVGEYHELGEGFNLDPPIYKHGFDNFTIELLESFFRMKGFEFLADRNKPIGKFAAWLPSPIEYETFHEPHEKIDKAISFCLYGDKAIYNEGMVRNALLAKRIFPEWTVVVFHDDTVPAKTLATLACLECRLVNCSKRRESGMFWRFLISKMADRWICRDADSRLSTRDRAAVEEWIESGCKWHVIRDSVHHTADVLTGLWGGFGTGSILEDAMEKWNDFHGRFDDQHFITTLVFPHIDASDIYYNDYKFNPISHERIRGEFVGQIIDEYERPL